MKSHGGHFINFYGRFAAESIDRDLGFDTGQGGLI